VTDCPTSPVPPSPTGTPGSRMAARDLALIAVFAGFIAALGTAGTVTPMGDAAPITAQTLGVMLAGSILGGRRAALAVLTFLVLVAAGLPLLPPAPSRPPGGLGAFASVSGGFLVGWVAGAWAIGRMVELWPRRFALGWCIVANLVGGILVIYAFGIPVMAWVTGLSLGKATVLSAVYLPGDLIKAVVAAVIASAVHRGYPVLLPRRSAPASERAS
jgi:biotin transport system substrate-specific component